MSRSVWWLFVASSALACRSTEPRRTGVTSASASPIEIASEGPPSPSSSAGTLDWEKLAEGWSHQMPLPDFELQDHTGRKFRLGEMSEGHVFVGLIFTHCSVATACPKTTQKMLDVGMAWRALRDGGGTKGRALRLLTLTFDPEEDTPEVLARYSSSMRGELPDWIFATGPSELMAKRLPAMLGVMAVPPRAGREISHNVKAVLLGPGLRVLRSWSNNAFEVNEVLDEVVGR